MQNFTLCIPTRVVFGAGASADIGAYVAPLGKRALLVSYPERPYLQTLLDAVRRALDGCGISVIPYLRITANPRLSAVQEAVDLARAEQVDFCIGIGGGSVMDATKAIAAGVLYEGALWRMFVSRNDRVTAVPPTRALPTVMLPTVAATSSEMNCVGVVTNDETLEKVHVSAPCLHPAVAVIDPALTLSVSPAQTAAGAVDAMSHLLEAYINGDQNAPVQDGLHESLLKTIMRELQALLADPTSLAHRTNMQWAATIAWNGWIQAGTCPRTPMHKMGHAVSALYNVTHGVTLAIFMNGYFHDICQKNEARATRFAHLGEVLFGMMPAADVYVSALAAVDRLIAFFRACGVPVTLREAGVADPDIERLVALTMSVGAGADGRIPGIEPISRTDLRRILNAVR